MTSNFKQFWDRPFRFETQKFECFKIKYSNFKAQMELSCELKECHFKIYCIFEMIFMDPA